MATKKAPARRRAGLREVVSKAIDDLTRINNEYHIAKILSVIWELRDSIKK